MCAVQHKVERAKLNKTKAVLWESVFVPGELVGEGPTLAGFSGGPERWIVDLSINSANVSSTERWWCRYTRYEVAGTL